MRARGLDVFWESDQILKCLPSLFPFAVGSLSVCVSVSVSVSKCEGDSPPPTPQSSHPTLLGFIGMDEHLKKHNEYIIRNPR